MYRKNFVKNYRNVDYVDKNGKTRTVVEYCGKYYGVKEGAPFLSLKILFTAVALLSAAAFVLGILFNPELNKTMYFILPYGGELLICFFLLLDAGELLFVKQPYKQENYDALFVHSYAWCVAGTVLAAVSLVSFVIKLFVAGFAAMDLLPASCVAVIGTLCLVLSRKIAAFRVFVVPLRKKG